MFCWAQGSLVNGLRCCLSPLLTLRMSEAWFRTPQGNHFPAALGLKPFGMASQSKRIHSSLPAKITAWLQTQLWLREFFIHALELLLCSLHCPGKMIHCIFCHGPLERWSASAAETASYLWVFIELEPLPQGHKILCHQVKKKNPLPGSRSSVYKITNNHINQEIV